MKLVYTPEDYEKLRAVRKQLGSRPFDRRQAMRRKLFGDYTPFPLLQDLSAGEESAIKSRLAKNGKLSILVHVGFTTAASLLESHGSRSAVYSKPFIARLADAEPGYRKALEKLLKSRATIAIFEEKGFLANTSLDLEDLGIKPSDGRVFFVATEEREAKPLLGWTHAAKRLRELGTQTVLIGGQHLTHLAMQDPHDALSKNLLIRGRPWSKAEPVGYVGQGIENVERLKSGEQALSEHFNKRRGLELRAGAERAAANRPDLKERILRVGKARKAAIQKEKVMWRCVGHAANMLGASFKTRVMPNIALPEGSKLQMARPAPASSKGH